MLAREQAHLDHARAELRRMRESTDRLDAAKATDAWTSDLLGRVLARRVASLQDDPRTTLFFGRIDTRTEHGAETFHIGRRHVSDDRGDPVVVDWRAPISTAFYRASPTAPMGVELRRRFGVDRGRLTAYEDERLTAGDATEHSGILAAEIERPRSGPMRDIVSTIQPEQDEVVRSDIGTSICVQGAPGTGKTAVGLHRAAWLLYSFRAQLDRSGVLVVGPNRAFLDHIGAVLPSLGEARVGHATIDTLLAHGRVRAEDPTGVAILKGDARLAEVLHRAVWAHVGRADDALVVPRGSRRWRVPAYEIQDELDALLARGVRYSAARDLLPQRLAHHVLLQMERSGDAPDDRVQDTVARSAPVTAYVRALWPVLDPAAVLFRLFSDAGGLAAAADGILTADEQRMLCVGRPTSHEGGSPVDPADLALLDEVADLLDRTPSLGHVVLDEAQDLSPMQLRAVGRRASTGSLTVLGDIAQGTTPWAHRVVARRHGAPRPPPHAARRARPRVPVPGLVIDFAARLLPHMAPGLGAPRSVARQPRSARRGGHRPLRRAAAGDRGGACRGSAARLGRRHHSGAGTATSSADLRRRDPPRRLDADHGDDEDRQVEPRAGEHREGPGVRPGRGRQPAAIAAAEPDERTDLRRLYVVLTRAESTDNGRTPSRSPARLRA